MFIKNQQRPWIEFSLEDGHRSPALVHYFSDRCEPFKTALPQLIAGAGGVEERVFVVESPLNEVMDETIALHRHPDFPHQVVVDEKERAFFDAVKLSLAQAIAKIEQIEFITVDANEDGAAGMDDMS